MKSILTECIIGIKKGFFGNPHIFLNRKDIKISPDIYRFWG